MNWLAVFIGGGAGSLTRYGINQLFEKYFSSTFPLATLFANIISCILLGLILALGKAHYIFSW
ncbi:MAG: CrcB family protein [Bacteroidetes bacterium]|nr:CrcB family protein [Bacteroidota bacterium]